MQLTYRGIPYTPSLALPSSTKTITGCYRGTAMTLQYTTKLPIQPFFNLRYRGVQYRPEIASVLGDEAIAI